MAAEWDTEDDEDYPPEDEAPAAVVAEVVEEEAVEEVTEEAHADEVVGEEGEAEAPVEEDPEAWRNLRIGNHPGQNYHMLMEAAEKEPALKRAIGTAAARYARKEYEPIIEQHREARERAEKQLRNHKVILGNFMFQEADRQNDPKLHSALHTNPQLRAQYDEWKGLTASAGQPEFTITPVLRDAATELDSMVMDANINGADESYVAKLQDWAVDQLKIRQNPYTVVKEFEEALDAHLRGMQNGNNNGQAARPAAARVAAAAPKPPMTSVDKGTNPKVGKLAPAASPRTGGTGRSLPKLKESQLEKYDTDPDGWDDLLKRYGVKDSMELRKKGYVVPG